MSFSRLSLHFVNVHYELLLSLILLLFTCVYVQCMRVSISSFSFKTSSSPSWCALAYISLRPALTDCTLCALKTVFHWAIGRKKYLFGKCYGLKYYWYRHTLSLSRVCQPAKSMAVAWNIIGYAIIEEDCFVYVCVWHESVCLLFLNKTCRLLNINPHSPVLIELNWFL